MHLVRCAADPLPRLGLHPAPTLTHATRSPSKPSTRTNPSPPPRPAAPHSRGLPNPTPCHPPTHQHPDPHRTSCRYALSRALTRALVAPVLTQTTFVHSPLGLGWVKGTARTQSIIEQCVTQLRGGSMCYSHSDWVSRRGGAGLEAASSKQACTGQAGGSSTSSA